MGKFIDLTGQEFGRLVILKRVENDKCGHLCWLCRCNCKDKNVIIVLGCNLKNGNTKSCGCLRKEITIKRLTEHGYHKRVETTEIYISWAHIIQRCTNPNNKAYHNYGDRGITVCKRWMKFKNFLDDMPGWKPGLTIERKNNNKGYYKENCYWATRKEQIRNRRSSLYVIYKGKRWFFAELCEEYNMPYRIVYCRYYRLNWTLEDALITPSIRKGKNAE